MPAGVNEFSRYGPGPDAPLCSTSVISDRPRGAPERWRDGIVHGLY